jgi:hypothetical protein
LINDHILKHFKGEKGKESEMSHMVSIYEDGMFEESDHVEFDDVTLKNPAETLIAQCILLFWIHIFSIKFHCKTK